jgi:hypothetical protein
MTRDGLDFQAIKKWVIKRNRPLDLEHTCHCRRRDRELDAVASAVGGRCRVRKPLRNRCYSSLGLSVTINRNRERRRQATLAIEPKRRLRGHRLGCLRSLTLALWLFATPASVWVITLGAVAAMLPDPLQFAHSLFPREPLNTLQRFHGWIHAKRKLAWKLGVSSQIAFATAVSALAGTLH